MTEFTLRDKMLIATAIGHMANCSRGAFNASGEFTDLGKKLIEVWK